MAQPQAASPEASREHQRGTGEENASDAAVLSRPSATAPYAAQKRTRTDHNGYIRMQIGYTITPSISRSQAAEAVTDFCFQ